MTKLDRLYGSERRAAAALASIFFLRMLGLFILLPVLALYANRLVDATPLLIGAAIGIYGLTQAALQIPLGRWSDRIGRKPVIAVGLLVFSAGGVLAALGGHIAVIIAGRALQGAGAISGATLALAADLTRPQQRTKVMAIIGISIGMSFSAAFILGPIIDARLGLAGLFLVAAGLGLAAQPILWFCVPDPIPGSNVTDEPAVHSARRAAPELRAMYVGIFCLHAILAASFVSIPLHLVAAVGIASGQHYTIYIPVLFLSLLCVGPMIMASQRRELSVGLFRLAIACVGAAELLLSRTPTEPIVTGVALTLFFIGFNFLEASLPSMVAYAAPTSGRGGALGTYATAQFMGMFAGGLGGGALSGALGYPSVFVAAAVVTCVWLVHTVVVPVGPTRASEDVHKR
ncbi:MAG: MFS transporter [Proteobacteria bacterium]|nr:MAG: MFS transporter [Pseudomonadota bacterium]